MSSNQEGTLNYKPIDFKDTDVQTYTLKINSKDRNLIREPNPFNFEIIFNQTQINNNQRAIISSKFERIKRITLSLIAIPRYIPRNYMGEPVTGITPVYNTASSISLSYYPGININNNVLTVLSPSDGTTEIKIEVVELVDLINRKLYLVAIDYNNPFYLTKYISVKAEIFSYININDNIYPITNITGSILTLGGTSRFPISETMNTRFIIADFYKNTIMVDTHGTKIYINTNEIVILYANILNFQFLFKGQYLEYYVNIGSSNLIFDRKLFKITNITVQLINSNAPGTVENSRLHIEGIWTDQLPLNYNNSPAFYDNLNTIRLNHFNFGVRDLLDEKIFYLNLYPFVPTREVSTDPNMNNSFGVLYPSTPNSSKDFLYLKGDATESYTNVNLQNTSNKLQFSLMDSNNQLIGTIYNTYFSLYQPYNISLTSYLPFMPDLNIILKIEEVDKKFNNVG
jgi:hypothetical protein